MTPRYPGGQDVAPEEHRPIVVAEGTPVWDAEGEKVGEVQTFGVETTTGQPRHLTLQSGFLSQSETEIPLEWVDRYGPQGIVLRETKEKVRELTKSTT